MTVSVKSLQKQLIAAIAMVLVAAIALGSSTYAWFVSNNTVKATTSTISAQSNSPFLKIDNQDSFATAGTESKFKKENVTVLYPAQVVGEFVSGDAEVTASTAAVADVKFQSAYASAAYSAAERGNTRFTVGKPDTAVEQKYAYMESFWIGSDDAEAGSFANLKVSGVSVAAKADAAFSEYQYDSNGDGTKDTTVTAEDAKKQMEAAVRLLIVNPETGAWQVWSKAGLVENYTDTSGSVALAGTKLVPSTGALVATIDGGKANVKQIDVYMFYDGADNKIFTNNMAGLHDMGATITFTAEAVSTTNTNTGIGD